MRPLSYRLLIVLALVVGVAACSASRTAPDPEAEAPIPSTVVDAWGRLDAASTRLLAEQRTTPCDADFGTWFTDFGVRGLACLAAHAADPTLVVAQAGGRVFLSGPHVATPERVALDLTSDRAFGHYDPAFVDWVAEYAVLGAGTPLVRTVTQSIYDRHMRRIARLYWLTRADLLAGGASDPALAAYARFLDGGPIPDGMGSFEGNGFSVFAFSDRSEILLPDVDLMIQNDWTAKYEANTAYGFWLRRQADGTDTRWHDALTKLLTTYDSGWLSAQG